MTTKVVCIACKSYAPLRARRVLAEGAVLPPVLTINAACHSAEHLEEVWVEAEKAVRSGGGGKKKDKDKDRETTKAFLPTRFAVVPGAGEEGDFKIESVEKKGGWGEGVAVYDLRVSVASVHRTDACLKRLAEPRLLLRAPLRQQALVVEIQSGTEDRHLVSIIKSTSSSSWASLPHVLPALSDSSARSDLCLLAAHDPNAVPVDELDPEASSPWFVFNDFLVTNISEQEALSFAGGFKVRPNSLLSFHLPTPPIHPTEADSARLFVRGL